MRTSTTILELLGRESTHPVWACLNLWHHPIVRDGGGAALERAGSRAAGSRPAPPADRASRA